MSHNIVPYWHGNDKYNQYIYFLNFINNVRIFILNCTGIK